MRPIVESTSTFPLEKKMRSLATHGEGEWMKDFVRNHGDGDGGREILWWKGRESWEKSEDERESESVECVKMRWEKD